MKLNNPLCSFICNFGVSLGVDLLLHILILLKNTCVAFMYLEMMVPYCYYLRYENLDILKFDYAYLVGWFRYVDAYVELVINSTAKS